MLLYSSQANTTLNVFCIVLNKHERFYVSFNFYIYFETLVSNHRKFVLCFPQPEEKMKFDSIFDSLGPVGGILTGDKVKPVLLNSKLPVDILGRV